MPTPSPRTSVRPARSAKPIVGIDLGGTNMQIGIVSADGKLIGRAKKKTKAADGSKAVIDRLVAGIEEAAESAGLKLNQLGAVGVGAPGAIDPKTGTVLQAPNLRWTNVPLARLITSRTKLRTAVTNDVRAAAIGEHTYGAGVGCKDMMCVWIGTGIGGGLILNNQLYTGHFNAAGEIGHMTIFPGAPAGSRSLEHNCSRTSIVDRILRLIRAHHQSIIPELMMADDPDIRQEDLHKHLTVEKVKARIVAQAYLKNDALTRQVVDDAARFLGIAIASLSSALSIQRVVLGGGLTEAMGQNLLKPVKAAFVEHVYPHVNRKCELVTTKLQADAGVFGAAIFARSLPKSG
jgi:glucokinase